MTESLDEILKEPTDTPVAETVIAQPEVKGEEQTTGQPRTPDGKFAPKDKPETDPEVKAAPPAAEKPVTEGQLAALMAEREKRQAAERERDELRRKVQPPPKAPDLYEAPEEWKGGVLSEVQQTVLNERLNMSEMMIRESKEDAEQAINAFMEVAAVNPGLKQHAMSQAHPYKFIYDQGKRIEAMKEIGDPVSYKDKIRAELRAEMEAEFKKEPEPALNLPTSLAGVRSSGARTGPGWGGPQPLNAILGARR